MGIAEEKTATRRAIWASRLAVPAAERAREAERIGDHLRTLCEDGAHRRIACYLSAAHEPGTRVFLEWAAGAGVDVLLPVMVDDSPILEWTLAASAREVPHPLGVPQPEGPPLGPQALDGVTLIVVPAAAVDLRGYRLGWGKGYYDRALDARTPGSPGAAADVVAVVRDAERLTEVPTEAHDVPVSGVVAPSGLTMFPTEAWRVADPVG